MSIILFWGLIQITRLSRQADCLVQWGATCSTSKIYFDLWFYIRKPEFEITITFWWTKFVASFFSFWLFVYNLNLLVIYEIWGISLKFWCLVIDFLKTGLRCPPLFEFWFSYIFVFIKVKDHLLRFWFGICFTSSEFFPWHVLYKKWMDKIIRLMENSTYYLTISNPVLSFFYMIYLVSF